MNDTEITKNLQNIAKSLDEKGHYKQADKLSEMLIKLSQENINSIENYFISDNEGNTYFKYENEDFKVPVKKTTIEINNKVFKLYFDPDNKKFFWYNDQGKPQAYLIDEQGKILEPRSKRYDLWKAIGGRRLFGDWRLPNLNKIIPLEPLIRKKIVPEIARPFREVGDVLRPVTRTITDPLGKAGEQLGIQTPGRKRPEQSKLEETFGKAEDRSTQKVQAPETKVPEKKQKGTKIRLEDIISPNDLLFWSMSTVENIDYEEYDQSKEYLYYSPNNKNQISALINKLSRSPWVDRKNSLIKNFAPDALRLLDEKIKKYHSKTTPKPDTELDKKEQELSTVELPGMSLEPPIQLNNDATDFGSQISGNESF